MEARPGTEQFPAGATSPFPRAELLLGILLLALVGSGYLGRFIWTGEPAGQDALMKAGLDALGRNDAEAAARHFRGVLQLNPNHYGATYQLATALDRAGQPAAARPYWEKMQ